MWPFKKTTASDVYVPPPVPSDEEIISTAPHTICPYTNVARGTIGYALLRLRNEGKLLETVRHGVLPDETRYIYEPVK